MGRKSVDKPDIDVMSGFCVNGAGSQGPVDLRAFGFLTYQTSFVFLARILIANALLYDHRDVVGHNFKGDERQDIFVHETRKSQDLFVRHVDGQTYVRRSVLIYDHRTPYVVCLMTTTRLQMYG
jgi:hypothetical protein